MASYINIHGNNIPIRASDPSNPLLGEIWYNSTTNLLKGRLASGAAAWSSLANRNNGMDSNSVIKHPVIQLLFLQHPV